MSLHVRVRVNRDLIGAVEIINETGLTDPDAVNTYAWTYTGENGRALDGLIEHRYGDGAIVLAANVLGDIAVRYEIAAGFEREAK